MESQRRPICTLSNGSTTYQASNYLKCICEGCDCQNSRQKGEAFASSMSSHSSISTSHHNSLKSSKNEKSKKRSNPILGKKKAQ